MSVNSSSQKVFWLGVFSALYTVAKFLLYVWVVQVIWNVVLKGELFPTLPELTYYSAVCLKVLVDILRSEAFV